MKFLKIAQWMSKSKTSRKARGTSSANFHGMLIWSGAEGEVPTEQINIVAKGPKGFERQEGGSDSLRA